MIIAVCTPLMFRVHETIQQAGVMLHLALTGLTHHCLFYQLAMQLVGYPWVSS